MRFLTFIGITFLVAIGLSSCKKNQNLSPIPSITFNSLDIKNKDSAVLRVNFTDGDGDVGYPSQDASAPYNFWVKYFYYDTTAKAFVAMWNINDVTTNDTVYFPYHVPYITPTGKDKSLTGIIQVTISPWNVVNYMPYTLNRVRFEVWLIDRAGHMSNIITTPEVNLGNYY